VTSSATGRVRLGEECTYETYTRTLEKCGPSCVSSERREIKGGVGHGCGGCQAREGAATDGKDDPGSPGNEPWPSRVAASGDRGLSRSVRCYSGGTLMSVTSVCGLRVWVPCVFESSPAKYVPALLFGWGQCQAQDV